MVVYYIRNINIHALKSFIRFLYIIIYLSLFLFITESKEQIKLYKYTLIHPIWISVYICLHRLIQVLSVPFRHSITIECLYKIICSFLFCNEKEGTFFICFFNCYF